MINLMSLNICFIQMFNFTRVSYSVYSKSVNVGNMLYQCRFGSVKCQIKEIIKNERFFMLKITMFFYPNRLQEYVEPKETEFKVNV